MLCVMSRHTDATLTLLQYSNSGFRSNPELITELLGNHSVLDPPDPIPNSEVKRNSADDSVGSPHVKVGHCQALNFKTPYLRYGVFFISRGNDLRRSDPRRSLALTGPAAAKAFAALMGWALARH